MSAQSDIRWLKPERLEDLPSVFDEVAKRQWVALCPPDGDAERLEPPTIDGTWLGVTSSGSTGRPKLVWRRWQDLTEALSHRSEIQGWCWAAPYAPWTFAGVQVALQAWLAKGRVFSLPHEWTEAWRRLEQERPQAVSATPTYLDLLVQEELLPSLSGRHQGHEPKAVPPAFQPVPEPTGMSAVPGDSGRGWSPRQITLGGEPLRPGVGRRLVARFPESRFTVIYAAAEFGVIATTHRTDGCYEVASLTARFPGGWRQSVGVLELLHGGQWRSTGDLIEVSKDLFRVIGRADGVANVAGTKVGLAEVAAMAEEVPGILRAVAVAEANPVTGQVVCLKYAPDPKTDGAQLAGALETHLRSRLRKEAWPRRWVVDAVAPTHNAKRAVA